MDHSLLLFALASCVVVLLINYVFTTSSKIRGLPLPPGPRTSWLGGVDLPKSYQWLTYASWKETYGAQWLQHLAFKQIHHKITNRWPCIYVYFRQSHYDSQLSRGCQWTSRKTQWDLLFSSSANYDRRIVCSLARPCRSDCLIMPGRMGWDWLFSAMPYGLGWRRHRTLFHKYFHISQSPVYHPGQVKETNTMLRNLLTSPEKFEHHIRRWNFFTIKIYGGC